MKLIDVDFAVNDHNGNPTGGCWYIHITDWLSLSCDHYDPTEDYEGVKFETKTDFVEIDGKTIEYNRYNFHVGNIINDCAWMTPAAVASLLNHLKQSGKWGCEEGITPFWERWNGEEPFTEKWLSGVVR